MIFFGGGSCLCLLVIRLWHLAAADAESVGALVLACSHTLGVHTPRAGRRATTRRLALTTTVRMVDGVHRHTTHRGAEAHPPESILN